VTEQLGSWVTEAACAGHDPARYLDSADEQRQLEALATCATCPVRDPCLDAALQLDDDADIGIWGGSTPEQRQRLRSGQLQRDDLAHLTGQQPTRDPGGPAPLRVHLDEHGDYIDVSGRVLITELPGGGYLALVDQRPVARTETLAQACRAASGQNSALGSPLRRDEPRRPQLELSVRDDGDLADPTGRALVTTGLDRTQHLVFLDGRFVGSASTVDDATALLGHTLSPLRSPEVPSGPRAPTLRSEGGARGSSLDVHMARPPR